MKKSICYILIGFAGMAMLTGCKPTEKNYQAAYDAAKAKREKANVELGLPATGLLSDDGPMLRIVDGDSIFVARERLRIPNDIPEVDRPKEFSVGVGVYKMSTNARAAAEDLKKTGYPARAFETTGERWYLIADSFKTLTEAKEFVKSFRKTHPGYPYIGLPGSPVVIGR